MPSVKGREKATLLAADVVGGRTVNKVQESLPMDTDGLIGIAGLCVAGSLIATLFLGPIPFVFVCLVIGFLSLVGTGHSR